MSTSTIIDAALALPPDERERLADLLFESLAIEDDGCDSDLSPEHGEEIRRRCTEIDSGTAVLIDATTAINEVLTRIAR